MDDIKLRVESLNVDFPNGKEMTRAVRGVSFALRREKARDRGRIGIGKIDDRQKVCCGSCRARPS